MRRGKGSITMTALTKENCIFKTEHPLDLLFDRAATLADRASNGSLRFLDAVDLAYSAADFAGLVDRYGDDVVQLVLADAFGARA
jgi:hypothetical protein